MNNDIILKLEKCNFKKESELVRECGSYLIFSHQEHIKTLDKRIKLKNADYCKFRFCSTCNWRRNLNINRELLQALEAIEATRSVSYLFLTLTIKNPKTEDLKATVKHLNDSFKRMSKTKEYKDTILGYFKALEIVGDKTPEGEVHPHLHIILIVNSSYFKSRNYIKQDKWSEMWQKALRVDYDPVVDVRRIKAKKTKSGKTLTALQSAVFEVAKYSVKHSILTEKSDDEFSSII
ncbi:MAG: protein rep, partial [Epsilonproteobacteria bacterium]|nr:protein rep [Campylobacterota bacterium]